MPNTLSKTSATLDRSLYAGRWIALTEHDEVGGIGATLEEARRATRVARPKEHERLVWVSPHPPHVLLPAWLLTRCAPLLPEDGVWLAGGAVRDLLLGRTVHDWDFAVAANARALARSVADALAMPYYTLDAERDTGRVIARDPRSGKPVTLDFAAIRGAGIEEDLRLRDFTINAMALTLDGQLLDPTGGQADLARHVIRMTHPRSFQDDPARLLRAVRQANRLHFHLDPKTEMALQAQAAAINQIAPERVRAELCYMLDDVPAAHGLQAMSDLGLLPHTLPEPLSLYGVQQSWPHHYPDAWSHTQATLTVTEGLLALLEGTARHASVSRQLSLGKWAWEMLENILLTYQAQLLDYLNTEENSEMRRASLLKWAALFHDVGKATTRTVDEEGLTHFYEHASESARLAEARLQALHFPNKATHFVTTLVRHHMRLISLSQSTPGRRACYRFYRDTGEAGVGVVLLSLADALAVWGKRLTRKRWQVLLRSARALLKAYFERQDDIVAPPPLLNGNDLLALGVPAGPEVGRLLELLRETQAAGEITTRQDAEALVRHHRVPTDA